MTAVYTLDAATVAEIRRLGVVAGQERDAGIALWDAEQALSALRAEEGRWLATYADAPMALIMRVTDAEEAVVAAQAAYDAFAGAYGSGEMCTCDQCW